MPARYIGSARLLIDFRKTVAEAIAGRFVDAGMVELVDAPDSKLGS
jgi:hypothetical protein